MVNISVTTQADEMIIRLNKKSFNKKFLANMLKRLRLEELAQRAGFQKEVVTLGEQIKKDWWKENGESFLQHVIR